MENWQRFSAPFQCFCYVALLGWLNATGRSSFTSTEWLWRSCAVFWGCKQLCRHHLKTSLHHLDFWIPCFSHTASSMLQNSWSLCCCRNYRFRVWFHHCGFLMELIVRNVQDVYTGVALLSLQSYHLPLLQPYTCTVLFFVIPLLVFPPSVFYLVSEVWTVRRKLTAWSLLNISNTHPVISCRLFFCCLQRNINTALISGRFLLSEFLLLYLSYNLPGGEVIKF